MTLRNGENGLCHSPNVVVLVLVYPDNSNLFALLTGLTDPSAVYHILLRVAFTYSHIKVSNKDK